MLWLPTHHPDTCAGQPEVVTDSDSHPGEVWEHCQWIACPFQDRVYTHAGPSDDEAHAPGGTSMRWTLQHINKYHPMLQARQRTKQTQTRRRSLKMSALRGSRSGKT